MGMKNYSSKPSLALSRSIVPCLIALLLLITQVPLSGQTITFDDKGYDDSDNITSSIKSIDGFKIDFQISGVSQTTGVTYDENNGLGGSGAMYPGFFAESSLVITKTGGGNFQLESFYFEGAFSANKGLKITAFLNNTAVNTATIIPAVAGGAKLTIPLNTDFDNVDKVLIEDQGGTFGFDGLFDHFVFSAAIIPPPDNISLAATVFLEGAYNGTDLNTALNSNIPTDQPYNGADFNNHAGTESANAPANAVDWVLIELREANSAALALNNTKVGSAAGFLMSDGSIKGTDGTSDLSITLTGNSGAAFFVVIYHRNHLPVMSASAITEDEGTYSIDFTSLAANTYQGTTSLVSLTGGKFGMPAGDSNGDGTIDADDLAAWQSNNGTAFSYGTNGAVDFNLDGTINAVDRNGFYRKNTTKERQVPKN